MPPRDFHLLLGVLVTAEKSPVSPRGDSQNHRKVQLYYFEEFQIVDVGRLWLRSSFLLCVFVHITYALYIRILCRTN